MGSQHPEVPATGSAAGPRAPDATLVAWAINLGLAGVLLAHPAICSRPRVSIVALTILAGAWLVVAVRAGGQWSRALPPRLPLLAAVAISMIAGVSLLVNGQAPWVGTGLLVLLFLLLAAGWLLAGQPGPRRAATVGFLSAAFFAAVYGWFQHYGLDPLPPSTPFSAFRVVSVFDNPNDLGSLLAGALPLVLALFLHVSARATPVRPVAAAAVGALLSVVYGGLLLAASRGAWGAGLASALVIAGYYVVQVWRGQLRWRPIPLVALGLLLAVVTAELGRTPLIREPGGVIGIGQRALSSRFVLRPYQETQGDHYLLLDTSIGHRHFIWAVTAEVIRASPLLGVGLGRFSEAFREHRTAVLREERFAVLNTTARTEVPDHAHNEFLHLWAETGAGGLVVFVVLTGAGLAKGACRAWREPAGSGLPVVGAVASVVATLVLGLVSYPLHLSLSAALFWVAIGFLWSEGSSATQPAQGRRMAG